MGGDGSRSHHEWHVLVITPHNNYYGGFMHDFLCPTLRGDYPLLSNVRLNTRMYFTIRRGVRLVHLDVRDVDLITTHSDV